MMDRLLGYSQSYLMDCVTITKTQNIEHKIAKCVYTFWNLVFNIDVFGSVCSNAVIIILIYCNINGIKTVLN